MKNQNEFLALLLFGMPAFADTLVNLLVYVMFGGIIFLISEFRRK